MSNRTMKQKANKLRRQRRAWAKSYSRPSGIIVNRGVLQEYKERACGLGISEFEVDETIRILYNREPIAGVTAGRTEIFEMLRELKKRVPELAYFSVVDTPYHRVLCYYNSTNTSYTITHTDIRKQILRTSIEYGSKQRALYVWQQDKVTWISQVPAPP